MWYYSVNDTRRGPMTITQLKSLVESAVLRPNDLVWREGMPGWVEAGTIPELFPAGMLPAHAPPPTPPTATPDDEAEEEPRSRRDDREAIQVHVHQVVERDEERRPRRRRRGGFCCPYCGSRRRPYISRQVSGAGWAVFVILLIFTIILCFIGLFIQEDVYHCSDCGARV